MTKNTAGSIDEMAAKPSPRVGALVLSLLIETDLDYEAIVAEVRKTIPDAKTTVRSIASLASIGRNKGQSIGARRKSTKALKRDSGSAAAPVSLAK